MDFSSWEHVVLSQRGAEKGQVKDLISGGSNMS